MRRAGVCMWPAACVPQYSQACSEQTVLSWWTGGEERSRIAYRGGGTAGTWSSLRTLLLSGVPGGPQRIRPAAQRRQAGMGRWTLLSLALSSSDLVILLLPTRVVDLGVDGMGPWSLVDLHSPVSNSSGC